MIDLAASEKQIPIIPDAMDQDPSLFNCPNGTIDLRTGELRTHRRSEFITQLCSVDFDPRAESVLWLQSVNLFLGGNQELID